jgi:hypothetical protein
MSGVDFFPKGIKNLTSAINEDNQKHYDEALRLYLIAVEYFLAGLKCSYHSITFSFYYRFKEQTCQ